MFLHLVESQVVAVLGDDLDWEGAGEGGYPACFPLVDVGTGVCKDGVGWLGHVCADGELVALGAGGDEEGSGKAGEGGDVGFERYSCGVFSEDIVEEGAVLDGGEHGRGGSCDDVAWDDTGGSIRGVRWEGPGREEVSVLRKSKAAGPGEDQAFRSGDSVLLVPSG